MTKRFLFAAVAVAIGGCSHPHHGGASATAERFFVVRVTRRDEAGRRVLRAAVEVSTRVAERRDAVGACYLERGSTEGWRLPRWSGRVLLTGAGLPAEGLAVGPDATLESPARVDEVPPFADAVLTAQIDADGVGARTLKVRVPGEVRLTSPLGSPPGAPAPAADGGAGDAAAPDAASSDPASGDGGAIDASPGADAAGGAGGGPQPASGPRVLDLDPGRDLEVTFTPIAAGRVQVVLGAESANGGYVSGFCNVPATAGRATLPRAVVQAVHDEGTADVSLDVFTVVEAASLRGEWQASLLAGAHGGTVAVRTKNVAPGRIPASPEVGGVGGRSIDLRPAGD